MKEAIEILLERKDFYIRLGAEGYFDPERGTQAPGLVGDSPLFDTWILSGTHDGFPENIQTRTGELPVD